MQTLQSVGTRLSEDEYLTLADYLDDVGLLEIDGVLGLLHAVAVAPSMMPPSIWLPQVMPLDGPSLLDRAETQTLLELLLRQYNEVLGALSRGQAIMPPAEDVDDCAKFAAGYAAGAQLDPEWIGDDERWTFAVPLAYLGDRLDLISDTQRAKIEADPNAKEIIRRDMGGIVRAAHDSFRRTRAVEHQQARPQTPAKAGRNDPCPCGSGRKFKRCCGAD